MASMKTRTQVAIVGAGPAGLMLAHLLRLRGVESVILENRSRKYVEERVRAGVLEQGTVDTLNETGLGERMRREGLHHDGVEVRFHDRSHRIDFVELTGRAVTVYGQQEVVKDLIAAAVPAGMPLHFECSDVAVHDVTTSRPRVTYRDNNGAAHELECDFIAGCDGFHGVCRPSVPQGHLEFFDRVFPFAWLGVLAESHPVSHELIYAHHERGFALFSMRSPGVTRLYLQCQPDENLDEWPDARIWEELQRRLGNDAPTVATGRITQKSVTPMRSFVTGPMSYGRLFLAGDAAHIVPPTGAKGMNLAIADVRVLSKAIDDFYRSGSEARLNRYSAACLRRVWKGQRFSAWMTSLLHRIPGQSPFDYHVQLAELDYLVGSHAAKTALAENYVGLPFEED
jgi:p-hydroxybenzoate 3-monooxygenase